MNDERRSTPSAKVRVIGAGKVRKRRSGCRLDHPRRPRANLLALPSKIRNITLVAAACALLAACGEPTRDGRRRRRRRLPPPSRRLRPPSAARAAGEPRAPDIPPPSAHIALNPGLYQAEGVDLDLSALPFRSSTFPRGTSPPRAATGRQRRSGTSPPPPADGDLDFPLECRLSRVGPAIAFRRCRGRLLRGCAIRVPIFQGARRGSSAGSSSPAHDDLLGSPAADWPPIKKDDRHAIPRRRSCEDHRRRWSIVTGRLRRGAREGS